MKTIYCVLLLLCPAISQAQQAIKPLRVGDTVPFMAFTQLVNGKPQAATLAGFKSKLIILDFWATWCSNCIREFPKMHSLQKEFEDSLCILLVNNPGSGDNQTKLSRFAAKYRADRGSPFTLPVLLGDTVLAARFPHSSLPHTAWIRNNRVMAITGGEELSPQNIRAALNDQYAGITQKEDLLNIDLSKPLLNPALLQQQQLLSSSVITGYIPGMGTKLGRYTDTALGTQRRFFINQPLPELYALVVPGIPTARMQCTIPAALNPQPVPGEDIPRSAKFSYECSMPVATAAAQWQYRMLSDLNNQFGLQSAIRPLPTVCYLLTRSSPGKPLTDTAGIKAGRYKNISYWLKTANLQPYSQTAGNYIVNETGIRSDSAVYLPDPAGHCIPSLAAALACFGYSLLPATRSLNWLFISPAPETSTTTTIFSPKN